MRIMSIHRLWVFLAGGLFLLFFCEVLIYWLVLLTCTWPQLAITTERSETVRAMFLADTHLLGTRDGHWLDKLRREWQMQRAFQTVMTIHNPDTVFVLGDLLDEGKWASDEEFHDTVDRFNRIFAIPYNTDLHVVVGNHDIGFHYMASEHKQSRFNKAWNTKSVRVLRIKGNAFVLINSIAMEGDRCTLCMEAEVQLREAAQSLKCSAGFDTTECYDKNEIINKPIILQHYPMYRQTDEMCEGPDAAEGKDRTQWFKERWDCISKESSDKILKLLNPRLIFSAHTHNGCFRTHPPGDIPEWTIASFNWRNRNNPVFLLAVIHKDGFAVEKCFLPHESTVISIYMFGGAALLIYLTFPRRLLKIFQNQRKKL